MDSAPPLTFAAVDDMAFAPSAARRSAAVQLQPIHLGPLAEFAILKAQGKLGASADGRVAQADPLWSMLATQEANAVVEFPATPAVSGSPAAPLPRRS